MNIKFSSFQNIDFEGTYIKEGELRISRFNSDVFIWNPIITRYDIKMTSSPVSIEYANETINIKLKTRSYNTKSLKLKIFISKQDFRPNITLSPQNLSHRASFTENEMIKWEIESLRYGGEYSVKFTKCFESFKIERIESSLIIIDKLPSGLFIDKYNIQYNNLYANSNEFHNLFKFQSNLEETYFF